MRRLTKLRLVPCTLILIAMCGCEDLARNTQSLLIPKISEVGDLRLPCWLWHNLCRPPGPDRHVSSSFRRRNEPTHGRDHVRLPGFVGLLRTVDSVAACNYVESGCHLHQFVERWRISSFRQEGKATHAMSIGWKIAQGTEGQRLRQFVIACSIRRDVKNILLPPPEARLWFAASSPLSDRSDARVLCLALWFRVLLCSISAAACSLVATTPIGSETGKHSWL